MPYIALNLMFGMQTDMWFKALSCGDKPRRFGLMGLRSQQCDMPLICPHWPGRGV